MDTSETYIKMCDCPEIQEQWKWPGRQQSKVSPIVFNEEDYYEGDYIVREDKLGLYIRDIYCSSCSLEKMKENEEIIWLPRQDQIQEMTTESHRCNKCLLERLFKFTSSDCRDESMEELWLKFYMHEEHGKIWDGKKWVKK